MSAAERRDSARRAAGCSTDSAPAPDPTASLKTAADHETTTLMEANYYLRVSFIVAGDLNQRHLRSERVATGGPTRAALMTPCSFNKSAVVC